MNFKMNKNGRQKGLASDKGYTLVEILLVVLILLILAAVGLASLLNTRQKSYDASAKSAVVQFNKAEAVYHVNNQQYTNDIQDLLDIDKNLLDDPGITFVWLAVDQSGYTINVRHKNGTRWFSAAQE